jgi:hypothetical protein
MPGAESNKGAFTSFIRLERVGEHPPLLAACEHSKMQMARRGRTRKVNFMG